MQERRSAADDDNEGDGDADNEGDGDDDDDGDESAEGQDDDSAIMDATNRVQAENRWFESLEGLRRSKASEKKCA
jgi:hypothetical protein